MNSMIFREHHLFSLLEAYDKQTLPLDLFISHYFRANKALGSKDRFFVSETTYSLIRWLALLDYLCAKTASWEERYQAYQTIDWDTIIRDTDIPLATRVSFPPFLFDLIAKSHPLEKTKELCLTSNSSAPTTIRVNVSKISRDELFKRWEPLYKISLTHFSPQGITFHRKINFSDLPEFKQGLFEVQDEGSQLLSQLVKLEPGDQFLDYCSGSGGKTLALASHMQRKGQIYLHDVRPFALQEAKKRLKRAGVQNAQILLSTNPYREKLKKKMNWVLVDAPCTGTGTMRRNPDMKWKFNPTMFSHFLGQQRTIFEKALSFMHPEGRIVYGTCSILKDENQNQVEHFLKTYELEIVGDYFQSLPTLNGMDGFFGVVLKRA